VKLIKDDKVIELENEIQITAYKRAGWTEAEPTEAEPKAKRK
jgi:hypothetical protein